MTRIKNNITNRNYLTIFDNKTKPIIMVRNSNLRLSLSSQSSSTSIANKKDGRLELIEIPKGLIEILQNAGFTIEKILDDGSSNIAETLGIESYVGEIIYKETKKASINIKSKCLIN
jgi:hypothetical protein